MATHFDIPYLSTFPYLSALFHVFFLHMSGKKISVLILLKAYNFVESGSALVIRAVSLRLSFIVSCVSVAGNLTKKLFIVSLLANFLTQFKMWNLQVSAINFPTSVSGLARIVRVSPVKRTVHQRFTYFYGYYIIIWIKQEFAT